MFQSRSTRAHPNRGVISCSRGESVVAFSVRIESDGEGIPILIQVVKTTQNSEVRKQAMSTLGQSRDPRAVTFFEEVLKK